MTQRCVDEPRVVRRSDERDAAGKLLPVVGHRALEEADAGEVAAEQLLYGSNFTVRFELCQKETNAHSHARTSTLRHTCV